MIREIILLFFKLGIIGFGGPAAHIALMRNEIVDRRKWMTDMEFLDLVGITNLIPGPNSTEMAIHIGKVKGGLKGLLLAGACFIIPAVLITFVFAVLYQKYGTLPQVQPFLYGIKPAIVAIILSAVYPLAKNSYTTIILAVIGVVSLGLSFAGIHELVIMLAAGIVMILLTTTNLYTNHRGPNQPSKPHSKTKELLLPLLITMGSGSVSVTKLFFIFLKIGAVLYGSGYVLFAFLETELVSTGMLTGAQLTDAIAVGQMTPGPVFSSVTFIGYIIQGWKGALFSTVAVFLPSFLYIALLSDYFHRLKKSKHFTAFLSGVIASSIALIASVAYTLGKDTLHNWQGIVIFTLAIVITFGFRKINTAYVVVGSSLLGYLLF